MTFLAPMDWPLSGHVVRQQQYGVSTFAHGPVSTIDNFGFLNRDDRGVFGVPTQMSLNVQKEAWV